MDIFEQQEVKEKERRRKRDRESKNAVRVKELRDRTC
jgi:hypothetical protein